MRDAMKAPDEEVLESFKVNKAYPWIERAVKRFFHYQVFGWAADAVSEHFGRDPLPGDKDMGNLLAFYEAGGKRYLEEGALPLGDRPMLEETLEAVRLTLMNTKGTISDYGRRLSKQDIEEALAQLGILEC